MTETKITCPECKWPVEPAVFCGNCGGELNSAPPEADDNVGVRADQESQEAAVQAAGSAGKPPDPSIPVKEYTKTEKNDSAEFDKNENDQSPGEVTGASSGQSSRMVADSDCQDISVEIDESTILAEGMVSAFRIQVTNFGESMTGVRMVLSTKDPVSDKWKSSNYRFPGRSRIPENKTSQAVIAFKPDSFGLQPFRCRLSFKRQGRGYVYETNDTVHTVYQQTDEPGQVINQVINNIENKGHAADVPVNNTVDFYRGMEHSASINQIIEKAKNAPSAWIPLALYEAESEDETKRIIPPSQPEKKVRTDKLSLQTSSFRIHLLTGDIITLGRQRVKNDGRANDIVTRTFSGKSRHPKTVQQRISRHHCHIKKQNDTVQLVDQGLDPHGETAENSWGTYINGEKVPAGQEAELPMNDEFVLSLAAEKPSSEESFALRCQIFGCDLWNQPDICPYPGLCGKNTPAAMIMHRFDDLNEIFIVLWGHLRLALADPGLGKLGIVRDSDAFALYGDFPPFWLDPGQDISFAGGKKITVLEEQQQCGMG